MAQSNLEEQIVLIEEDIKKVERKIDEVEDQIEATPDPEVKKQLREKERQLREKERQLREEEGQLRKMKVRLMPSPSVSYDDLSRPDVTFEIRDKMSQPVHPLPPSEELADYIQKAPAENLRFPVPLWWFCKLPDQNRDKLFRLAQPEEVCEEIKWILDRLVDPPRASGSTNTFHHLWDSLINDFLRFFTREGTWVHVRNPSGEGTSGVKRPNLVARIGYYALWRAEERGPSTPGDPEEELLDKLLWTYGPSIPYVLAYHARAHSVTFCTLFKDQGGVRCTNLKVFHLQDSSSRVALLLACLNIARLFPTLEALCHSEKVESDIIPQEIRPSGKVIEIYGRSVVKSIPPHLFRSVVSIYNSIKGCPYTEVLLHTSDGQLVFERGLRQCPASLTQLVECLCCICGALVWLHQHKFMHRDIRWENVVRDLTSENVWRVLDFDDMARSPCSNPTALDPRSHAPEIKLGIHEVKVDIWGIGFLLKTTRLSLPNDLHDLKDVCLSEDPSNRPSAKECLRRLQAIR